MMILKILCIVLEKIWYGNFEHADSLGGLVYKMTRYSSLKYLRDNKKSRNEQKNNEALERKTVAMNMSEQDI